MLFKALVKNKDTGEVTTIESDYSSKSDFINDLKHNGYSVHRAEPKELYDFVVDNSNGNKWDWETAKKLYKENKPLTKEEFEKMKDSEEKLDYEVVNDKSIDAIKDNFTPPGAKIGVDNEYIEYSEKPKALTKDHIEKYGEEMLKKLGASDEQIAEAKKDIDTNDNGEIEVDEMADFQKSLDDYAAKNKKGRDDIPVTTRR